MDEIVLLKKESPSCCVCLGLIPHSLPHGWPEVTDFSRIQNREAPKSNPGCGEMHNSPVLFVTRQSFLLRGVYCTGMFAATVPVCCHMHFPWQLFS